MYILGINAFHGDSSACLVRDGLLLSAAEEERFRRIKHWAGFPSESISFCLEDAGIRLSDVEIVAINQDSKANLAKKIRFTLESRPSLGMVMDRLRNKKERGSIEEHLSRAFPEDTFNGKVERVEHHLAHLSSAFHVSPFESAVVASVDGFGDFASGAWGVGKGTELQIDGRVFFPHSLGIFYQALTQFLGFPHYGDEYKIMGLAPYGKPTFLKEMRNIVLLQDDGGYKLNLEFFRHHQEKLDYEWDDGAPVFGALFSDELGRLLGPVRKKEDQLTQVHKDLAHSIQAMYEEAFFHLLGSLHAKHQIPDLTLSGGCAMNSVANGKVYRRSPFKRLYIPAAAGDAGGAIGAAFMAWNSHGDSNSRFVMDHAFWGPSYDDSTIWNVLQGEDARLNERKCKVEKIEGDSALCFRTATAISEGKVVGWFQGRMEWGPRALGGRSILCDPRRADMKKILNSKIKRRESFRPFAPSILRRAASEWFEEDDDIPFMMKVFQIREHKRMEIPAVTHVDGSGRLQTVSEESNSLYHKVIEAFERITGVPIVLNTSFNENEPVVCKPEEALDCFLRTNMDVLVIGNYMVARRS